jgi:SAM-dependent methyltransferase
MPQQLPVALAEVRAALLQPGLVRAVAAGRKRAQHPTWRRVELRYVDLKAGRHLQVSAYDDTKAHVRNEPAGEAAAEAVEALLAEPFGNWHVETSTETLQLRVTKKGDAQLHRTATEANTAPPADGQRAGQEHDRRKPRLLDPTDPVWQALGIADRAGQLKPSRQRKFRQVEEFVRLLAPVLDEVLDGGRLPALSAERPLRVADLGCGNAYLTFAAYSYLTSVRGLPVQMVGVDSSGRAARRNAELAEQLGWAGQLSFVEATISAADLDPAPDVVLALHACDTATDDALARAVRWHAPLVLASPCCHHDVQKQLRAQPAPAPYGLLVRHGILRERFADVLTDTARAALLRLHGYRTDAVKFVDSQHTERNVLLRSVRTGAAPSEELRRDYVDLTTAWSVTPALERALPEETDLALGRPSAQTARQASRSTT